MKWSITQLRKYQGKPFEFNEKANFDDLIEPLGLIDLSEMNIEGELTIKSNACYWYVYYALCSYISACRCAT